MNNYKIFHTCFILSKGFVPALLGSFILIFNALPAPFAKSYMIGRENRRTNNRTILPALKKNNAAAGYKGQVIIGLLKGAGLLFD